MAKTSEPRLTHTLTRPLTRIAAAHRQLSEFRLTKRGSTARHLTSEFCKASTIGLHKSFTWCNR